MKSSAPRVSYRTLLWLWGPVVVCMGAIFALSSCPSLPKPPGICGFDKFQHFSAYGCLAFLTARAIRGNMRDWNLSRVASLAVVIAAIYGITDEFHQRFVPNRSCDVFDWTADVTGAILGTALLLVITGILTKLKTKS